MDIKELLSKVGESLSVRRAFGTAYERDGALVIPVALVAGGGGAGEGTGPVTVSIAEGDEVEGLESDGEPDDTEAPSGSGGGFGGVVLPVGVYEVRDGQVRWVPAVNVNMIAMMALGVLLAAVRSVGRRRRHRRA